MNFFFFFACISDLRFKQTWLLQIFLIDCVCGHGLVDLILFKLLEYLGLMFSIIEMINIYLCTLNIYKMGKISIIKDDLRAFIHKAVIAS